MTNFQDYTRAISIATKASEKYGSVPEVMVAIELIRIGYSIIPQQKIKKYKVDFAIPKEKIVIEVDGSIYHKDVYKGDREAIIQLSLGLDWKIIHVPAEYISKDIQKLEQIIKILSKALNSVLFYMEFYIWQNQKQYIALNVEEKLLHGMGGQQSIYRQSVRNVTS